MFEKLFVKTSDLVFHKIAPYAVERERFLEHCCEEGFSKATLSRIAGIVVTAACDLHAHGGLDVDQKRLEAAAARIEAIRRQAGIPDDAREYRREFLRVTTLGSLDCGEDEGGCPLNATQRLCQRGAVAAIQVDVVAGRVGDVEPDRVADDKGDGLGLEFARVARLGAFARMVKEFMGVLVDEHRELGRGLQAVHDLNTSPAGGSQRAAKLFDIFDRDALRNDRRSWVLQIGES
jgi:hypothetical protein